MGLETAVEGERCIKVDERSTIVDGATVESQGEGGSCVADLVKGEGDGFKVTGLDCGVAEGIGEAARDERRSDREGQEGEGLCELFHSNSYSCQKILF